MFMGIDNLYTKDGLPLWRLPNVEIIRNNDGSINTINTYLIGAAIGTSRLNQQFVFQKTDNITIVDNIGTGLALDVLIEEESGYSIFRSYQRFINTPDRPDFIIEINGNEVILSDYNFLTQRITGRSHFIDGILMRRELSQRVEIYTIDSGIGEVIITTHDGEEIERWSLERRIDDDGFLIYQSVVYPSGGGYEFLISKDNFD